LDSSSSNHFRGLVQSRPSEFELTLEVPARRTRTHLDP
jgi:hypothetical protein